ncbi:MAG: hypothetical protein ND895_25470 [Pyrinomonadaceae bacterium]|nr:hypothetical protein [Pyrinomonadaceae bacterium]
MKLSKLCTILFALVGLAITACSLHQPKSGPGSSSGSSSKNTTAFTPSSDARKDLGDALRKLKTAYPYRLTESTSATANGQIAMPESTRMVEFAAPDRSHMKWTGGTAGDLEQITIGEKRYSNSGGKWAEESGPSMSQRVKRGEEFANKLGEMIKEVKYVGPEAVNSLPCYAYTYTMETTLSGQIYVGTGKAWIGAADGLPHQNDSEFKVATYGQKSHIVYEYNVSIKIEKPPI